MINLNECKFGDKLRTESGDMAVYLGKSAPVPSLDGEVYTSCYCAMEYGDSFALAEYDEYGCSDKSHSNDIVGRWGEEVKRPVIPYIKEKPLEEIKLPKGVSEEILRAYGKGRFK